ncbi:MAG: aspartate/glutamate racemase family protein [Lachnospiraceae bacterium]|nr:aspartate/glutamate racemase family protein [Lachnospiraceae bacterium]
MEQNIRYGYLDSTNDRVSVKMKKGQNIAGYPVGIVYIDDVYYPMLPGNIVNGYTFDFPVRLKAVEGLDCPNLFDVADGVYEKVLTACQKLEQEGVRAISGACGFFGNFQAQIADEMNIPVALSSLVQLPWIDTLLKKDQRIGVLTAQKDSFTDRLLDSCGVDDRLKRRLIVKDLGHEPEFSCIIEGRGEFDNGIVCKEVVTKALEITKEAPDTGAILLECSDMPPYAYAVQNATGLPVFDFTTLIRWLHSAVTQTPYCGFI